MKQLINPFKPAEMAAADMAMEALLDLPARERHRFIDELSTHNPELQQFLSQWIEHIDEDLPADPMSNPAIALLSNEALIGHDESQPILASGARIGPYRVLRLIGRGGMGEVYCAERADGQYQQQVALKLVRHEMADKPSRFQDEKAALAQLAHPDIARLLDAGVDSQGRPYMVMELVTGESLTAWCKQPTRSLTDRLKLFARICRAVAYAHRNLIVHRDIKPGNILVTREGGVKLLDFGIAKLLKSTDVAAEATLNVPMTPTYAAPETLLRQAVTPATDVYSLGILLFELLTDARPWDFEGISLIATIEKVLRESPSAPSTRAALNRNPPIAASALRGDLDAIFAKAVRKAAKDRYADARELGDDVERALRREPVRAREGATLYKLQRFTQRNWLVVTVTSVVLIALLVGLLGTLWQARAARMEARRADAVQKFLVGIFEQNSANNPDGAQARQTTAEHLLDIGAERIRGELKDQPQIRDAMFKVLMDLYDQMEKFDKIVELQTEHLAEIIKHDGAHPSVERADTQFQLGRALLMNGDYAPAQQYLLQALEELNALADRKSTLRAVILMHLGRIAYHRRGPADMVLAQRYASEALSIYRRSSEQDPDRIMCLQLLARLLERDQRFDEAEQLYREALSLAQRPQFAAQPTLLAKGYDDLGSLLLVRRRYDEAEPMLRETIRIYSASLGEDALDTVGVTGYLGQLLVETNRGDAGEAILRRGLEKFQQTQGVDNLPSTAVYRLRFARTQILRGNLAQAHALLEANIGAFEKKDPDNHNVLPRSLWAISEVSLMEGHILAARAELARGNALWQKTPGRGSEEYGDSLILSAALALREGAPTDEAQENARQQLQSVIDAWREAPGSLSEPYVRASLALADLNLAANRFAKVSDDMSGLLEQIQAHPQRQYLVDWEARCRAVLGRALAREDHTAAAVEQLEAAMILREKFDAPDSPDRKSIVDELSRLHPSGS